MLEYSPGWHGAVSWILYLAFVVAFFVAFGMGANDCANSYGTVVGAGVLKLWQAYLLATFFELLGAGLLGYRVTETMQKSLVRLDAYDVYSHYDNGTSEHVLVASEHCLVNGHPEQTGSVTFSNGTELYQCTKYTSLEFMLGELGVLIGTAAWLLIATVFHAPVSTTQSAVGATVGFSLVVKGTQGTNFMQIVQIVISWLASPLLAGFFAVLFYIIVRQTVFSRQNPFDSSLRMLPIFYFSTLSVNLFSVLYGGSKYLMLDKLTWWHCLLISLMLSTASGLVMHFYGVKKIDQHIRKKYKRKISLIKEENAESLAIDLFVKSAQQSEKEVADVNVPIPIPVKNTSDVPSLENSNSQVKLSREGGDRGAPAAASNGTESSSVSPPQPQPMDEHRKRKGRKKLVHTLREPMYEDPMAQEVFNYLQILSACFLSFSHGSNDTANAVGPLVAIWCTAMYGRADMDSVRNGTLELLILFGGVSMIIGLWVLGHKVIGTIGTRLTKVTSPSGFAMELGTAFTVLFASKMGIPISTTHCAVGAVVSVGWMRSSTTGVSWKTFRNIAIAWLITLPVSGSIAALASWLLISHV